VKEARLLSKLYRAMALPGFYPHTVKRVVLKETHISKVFLTGDLAYKVKKPLNLGFLDFHSLSRRRHFCKQEVRLNQRLSSGVYIDVLPIYQRPDGTFSFKGPGAIVEYTVKMRQLPDAAAFRSRLKAGKMRRRLVEALGRKLSAFYDTGLRGPKIDRFGSREMISVNMEENFSQLQPYLGTVLPAEKWEFIRQVSRAFLSNRKALFENRIASGRIRDGHGDLRTDHVYFYRGIQIIDCIEFSDRFRYGDVVSDIAFLYMDLEHFGLPRWSMAFLDAYVASSEDREAYALVDFYAVYRAIVRLKVTCLKLPSAGAAAGKRLRREARLYLGQAYRYAVQFARPTLWMTCGLPASGKSTLARGLSEALRMPWIRSDGIRKGLFPRSRGKTSAYGRGMYRSGMQDRVYAKMLAMAQDTLRSGDSVLLDAAFSRRKWRQAASLLAHDLDTNLICVECVCPETILRERLSERQQRPGLSDARNIHLNEMIRHFEEVAEMPPGTHFKAATDRDVETSLNAVLSKGFDLKRRQVQIRLREN